MKAASVRQTTQVLAAIAATLGCATAWAQVGTSYSNPHVNWRPYRPGPVATSSAAYNPAAAEVAPESDLSASAPTLPDETDFESLYYEPLANRSIMRRGVQRSPVMPSTGGRRYQETEPSMEPLGQEPMGPLHEELPPPGSRRGPMPPSEFAPYHGEPWPDEGYHGECSGCGHCGHAPGAYGPCPGGCCNYHDGAVVDLSHLWPSLEVSVGGHGFEGPADFDFVGNFGFNVSANLYGCVLPGVGLGYQIGYRFADSNFEGQANAGFPGDVRQQHFVTAGLFHRAVCQGWQWGIVVDHLSDHYYETISLTQLRTQLGFVFSPRFELGFYSAIGTDEQLLEEGEPESLVEPLDQYIFYLARCFPAGAWGRIGGGFSGQGQGILRADFDVPLSPSWSLDTNLLYVASDEANRPDREAWALSLNLVWHIGYKGCTYRDPYQPLFRVADNSEFVLDFPDAE